MSVDMFIKIDGVDGESKDDAHTDEIDVLSWSWGMTQSGSFHVGGGGGAGKVDVQDLSFTKYVDKASTPLMLKCCKGSAIAEATLTVRKAGGDDPVEYLVIKMEKLLVSSISTGGSGGEDSLTENVTLNFAKVETKYQPQDDEGAPDGGTVDMGWDIEKNKEP